MNKYIDWIELSVPGTCIGWNKELSLIGAAIRGVTAGPAGIIDSTIPQHISMSWPRNSGLMTQIEMVVPKIRRDDLLGQYKQTQLSDHIVFAATPPALIDDCRLQKLACMWMRDRLDEGIPYPIKNLLAFLGKDHKPVEKVPVCSMLYVLFLQWLQPHATDYVLPDGWIIDGYPALINPLELCNWLKSKGWSRQIFIDRVDCPQHEILEGV